MALRGKWQGISIVIVNVDILIMTPVGQTVLPAHVSTDVVMKALGCAKKTLEIRDSLFFKRGEGKIAAYLRPRDTGIPYLQAWHIQDNAKNFKNHVY